MWGRNDESNSNSNNNPGTKLWSRRSSFGWAREEEPNVTAIKLAFGRRRSSVYSSSDEKAMDEVEDGMSFDADEIDEVHGSDPKQQICQKRYVLLGLAGFLVCLFLVAEPFGVFAPSEAGKSVIYVNVDPNISVDGSIRINAGSAENYIDPKGNVWLGDANLEETGSVFRLFGDDLTYDKCPLEIADSSSTGAGLFCTERYFPYGSWGSYQISVPYEGVYTVTLYFADIFLGAPGERIFEVDVNGQEIAKDFDIVETAGAAFTATSIRTQQPVADGKLSITFYSRLQHAKISAIEVVHEADE